MVEELARGASELALCVACSRLVDAGARCPTCGESGAGRRVSGPVAVLDEALLDRVDVAVAAQAALACRTAAQRVEVAGRLLDDAVVLRGRLRRQSELLRARVDERKELVPALRDALDRVQAALDQADCSRRPGEAWSMAARLPRDSTCPGVARGLLAAYAREELDEREAGDAMLIASELATNAFLHGVGVIVLKVHRLEDRLRIEVRDDGHPDHIGIVSETNRQNGGRGLWIVDQLSSDWGAVDGAGHVWAELAIGGGSCGST